MAGSTQKILVIGAICLSLAAHGGFAVLAGSFGVTIGAASDQDLRAASTPLLLLWSDEPPAAPEPELQEQPPEQTEPQPPEPPDVDTVTLCVAEAAPTTENWMGFDKPTPHAALRSDVEQPALDPNAGAAAPQGLPGLPSPMPQPATPPTPPAPTFPAAAPGLPALPPEPAQPPAAQPIETRAPQQPVREPLDAGGTEPTDPAKDIEDDRGTLLPELPDPNEPMLLEGSTEQPTFVPPLQNGFVGPPFEASDATDEARESAESSRPALSAPPAPAQPSAAVPQTPPTPPTSPAQAGSSNPGAVPGEASERESDASSPDDPVEIRLGRPAAAKGLEIVTKRPDFSRLTRMTVYPPNNPRLKVTFNREGRVSEAQFIEPTGLAEIDSPVLNAVYRWTAKGEALSRLPTGDTKAGLSITVTILLR